MKKTIQLTFLCVLFSLNAMGQFKGLLNKSGTIVFSKTKIDPENGKTLPHGSFEPADKPLAMAFLSKPLSKNKADYGDKITWFYVRVTINEKRFTIYHKNFKNEEEASLKELEFQLFDIPKELQVEKFGSGYEDFISFVNGLKEGSYPIKVEITRTDDAWAKNDAWTIYTFAEGELTLIITKNSGPIKLGKNFKSIEEIPNKKTLADSALKLLREVLPITEVSRFSGEVLAAKITTEWDILYHKGTGAILGRICNVISLEKNKDGTCRASKYCLKQDYAGNGFLKKLTFEGRRINTWPIDCE